MYDENKIKDSLEFVDQIKMYYNFDPEHIRDRFPDDEKSDISLNDHSDDHQGNYLKKDDDKKVEDPISVEDEDSTVCESVAEEDSENSEKTSGIAGDILYIFACMIISIIVAFAFTRLVAHHTVVDGNSMTNTLDDGDCLIIEKISYYMHPPERYDIIVFPFSSDTNYIKRIIGLPGETVQIKEGYVYINDKKLTDDIYGRETINNPGLAESPVKIGEDEYFVMGDNRNSSYDSRKSDVGLVKKEDIDGKAVFRLWPFDGFGTVE